MTRVPRPTAGPDLGEGVRGLARLGARGVLGTGGRQPALLRRAGRVEPDRLPLVTPLVTPCRIGRHHPRWTRTVPRLL